MASALIFSAYESAIERKIKLTEYQFNNIKNFPLGWSSPYQLTDIVFSITGNAELEFGGWIVRLREKEGNIFIFDYKSPLNKEFTEWDEIETQVNNFDNTMSILLKIGLSPVLVLDRIRTDCIWDNFKLTLDNLKFIGHFLEIEIVDINKDANFNLFSTHFNIELGDSQPPYGKIMLKEMENNSNINQEISDYIKLKSEITEINL